MFSKSSPAHATFALDLRPVEGFFLLLPGGQVVQDQIVILFGHLEQPRLGSLLMGQDHHFVSDHNLQTWSDNYLAGDFMV